MKVGMIGLGAMGINMAKNVARTGLLTTVYNRTLSKAEKLASHLNISHCTTPQELAEQVDLILVCVSADKDVLEIMMALSETINPDSIVVDMSTVSNETAIKAASLLLKKNAYFLDAPVSGGVEGAKNGTLAMMVGGDKNALETARPVLASMSTQIIHMGMSGTGQSTKAVNQIMAAGINQAVTEALAFGQAQHLDMEKVIRVISSGAAGNWFLQHRGTTMSQGSFNAGFKLALHHKDLKICQSMAKQNNSPTNVIDNTLADYKKLLDQGFADEDISALYRLKRN